MKKALMIGEVAHYATAFAALLIFISSLMAAHADHPVDPRAALIYALLSALFWISAALLPFAFTLPPRVLDGLNAIAAAATAAAAVAGANHAWTLIFG